MHHAVKAATNASASAAISAALNAAAEAAATAARGDGVGAARITASLAAAGTTRAGAKADHHGGGDGGGGGGGGRRSPEPPSPTIAAGNHRPSQPPTAAASDHEAHQRLPLLGAQAHSPQGPADVPVSNGNSNDGELAAMDPMSAVASVQLTSCQGHDEARRHQNRRRQQADEEGQTDGHRRRGRKAAPPVAPLPSLVAGQQQLKQTPAVATRAGALNGGGVCAGGPSTEGKACGHHHRGKPRGVT